jgi:N-acetylglucosaminyldiphosphoundecaprenol N-acetyl-beta-D-mannosaminyltransferase
MVNHGKHDVLGVGISAVDYEYAVQAILDAARTHAPFTVATLAVHGVMTGFFDAVHRRRLNGLDLVAPDGQPVRWALRWLHGIALPDRVYGPALTLKALEAAAVQGLPVYFYGSTEQILQPLIRNLQHRFPRLIIAGSEPSKFRRISQPEKAAVVRRIQESGARMVFVGLGCPRQEVWVYEYQRDLAMPLIAVGAAFAFHAAVLPQAPPWMQNAGLEWLYRLVQEPQRLWRRYLFLNPTYLLFILLERFHVWKTATLFPTGMEPEEFYG